MAVLHSLCLKTCIFKPILKAQMSPMHAMLLLLSAASGFAGHYMWLLLTISYRKRK